MKEATITVLLPDMANYLLPEAGHTSTITFSVSTTWLPTTLHENILYFLSIFLCFLLFSTIDMCYFHQQQYHFARHYTEPCLKVHGLCLVFHKLILEHVTCPLFSISLTYLPLPLLNRSVWLSFISGLSDFLLIYLLNSWLRWLSVCCSQSFLPVVASGGCLQLRPVHVASLVGPGLWALASVDCAWAQQL